LREIVVVPILASDFRVLKAIALSSASIAVSTVWMRSVWKA